MWKTAGAIASVVVLLVLSVGFGYIGFSNDSNRFENEIKAKYDSNRNIYDNGWKAVMEMAQVPDIYASKVKEVYQAALQGRYGKDGSKAVVQLIQEQNPNLDSQLFSKVQQKVEAFRNEFAANQDVLISRKQEYQNYLTATTSGRFYNTIGGYPRIDLTKYDIVTSGKTETDFSTKKSEPLNLKQ